MIPVEKTELGALGDEEGDGGVEGADEEVDGEVVVKVLRCPELLKKKVSAHHLDRYLERRSSAERELAEENCSPSRSSTRP